MPNIDLEYDFLNYIADKHPEPGSRLPTINELKHDEHLGVSVSKIREQLEVARAMGLVEVRSKTGMRMKAYSFTPAARLSLLYAIAADPHNFEFFSALRHHLELAFWDEACALLTDDDRAIMRACVTAARAKLSGQYIHIPNDEHRIFHLTVFKRLDNPFVLGLLEAYWDAYKAIALNRYADLNYHLKVWTFHEQILDAICANEFEQARTLFDDHTRLLRYEQQNTTSSDMEDAAD
jgi:DNA-binding FadR family transcriptional regulator